MFFPPKYWRTLAGWTTAWAVAVWIALALAPLLAADARGVLRYAVDVPRFVGAGLPLVIFAAGAFSRRGLRDLLGPLIITGVAAYALVAVVDPIVQFERLRLEGFDLSRYPFGADTPETLLRRRAHALVAAPPRYSYSVDAPLSTAPNWITWLIYSPAALGLAAIGNGALGAVVARWNRLDRRGSPAVRLWTWGIGSALALLAAHGVASDLVRLSPEVPAWPLAFIPATIPALALAVAWTSMRDAEKTLALQADLGWDALVTGDYVDLGVWAGDAVAVRDDHVLHVRRLPISSASVLAAHPERLRLLGDAPPDQAPWPSGAFRRSRLRVIPGSGP